MSRQGVSFFHEKGGGETVKMTAEDKELGFGEVSIQTLGCSLTDQRATCQIACAWCVAKDGKTW